jgi:DNA-directed RNA polymerase
VDEREQASGLLPNYIHSLDSAHLIRTIERARKAGLREFSVVHDSYGTHACDMPVLARCVREAFVAIYSQNPSQLSRFEQWCAALSVAARAPRISADEFGPYIHLTNTEKGIYDMVAGWAGRDSSMVREFARTGPELIERLPNRREVRSRVLKRLLVFAADKVELEWPADVGPSTQLGSVIDSAYFFS